MIQKLHSLARALFLILSLLLVATQCGCSGGQSEHGIGPDGRTTPSKIFKDPGVRALAEAAGTGNLQEIDRLAASGVNINAVGEDGVTPLLWAMLMHNHDSFERLLERGADPNQKPPEPSHFLSAIGVAAGSQLDDSFYLDSVLRHGGNPNLLESAGKHGDVEVYQAPLGRAAMYSRRIKNLELLISAGADLNHKGGFFGETPLMEAELQGWYEGVYYLLQANVDYTVQDDSGTTLADFAVPERIPLTTEVRYWKDKVLDFLQMKGVDLEAARRRAEAMGTRTKKWEPGEVYQPKIQEFRGPQYPGYESH